MPTCDGDEVEGNVFGQAKKKSFSRRVIETVKTII